MSHRKIVDGSLYFVFMFLVGCAGMTPTMEQPSLGVDRIACVGEVEHPPKGLVEIKDTILVQKALGASGQGKLCVGNAFVTTEPVPVYRVWNKEKSYTLYGSWWSFELPKGPKQKYREENGICPSWSPLDRMSSCTIKVGTNVVVGPGQSAVCEQVTYPKSAVNQVFIPNDSRNNMLLVENCSAGADWP
ncbi:MAG: hypothetical protein GKS05_03115 [Nitrospirales bacterium]|nr:hypothetical protein [Nitrospirales bacterium]